METKPKNLKLITEMCMFKKRVNGENIEYHQIKTIDKNTKEKNQWRHKATRKQKITIGNFYTLIITLNVNGQTSPIKRQGVVNWVKQTNKQNQPYANFRRHI